MSDRKTHLAAGPRPRRSRTGFVSEIAQFTMLIAAMLVSWLFVLEPVTRSVRQACSDRLAVLDTLRALERSAAIASEDGTVTSAESASLQCALEELREAWAEARLAPRLRPGLRRSGDEMIRVNFEGRLSAKDGS